MQTIRTVLTAASAAALASAVIVSPALATPGHGFAPSGIVVGHYGPIDVDSTWSPWEMHLTATPDTDVGADKLTVQPGGESGWHAHPSAVFVTVTQGSIKWQNGSDPLCPKHTYTAGQSFIEQAGVNHNVRNASKTDAAEFIAIHINPTGTSGPGFRLDRPKPTNCGF